MAADVRVLTRLRERLPRGDAGMTLIELIVGMAIMTVFMGMFTGAMLLMSNTSNAVQVISDTSNQASNTYLRLDHEIRYASAITTPAFDTTSSMWHVEFLTSVVSRTGTNSETTINQCTQLAVAAPSAASGNVGILKQRTWNVGDTAPGTWGVLTSGVTNYGSATATSPFPTTTTIAGGNASTSMQQITIRLVVAAVQPAAATTTSTYTFTALNSSTSNTTPVCQQFAVGS